MSNAKCIIILSEKSSGSSACQNLLTKFPEIRHVSKTSYFESETLYWTLAASVLGRPQTKMVDSKVPFERNAARTALVALLKGNLDDFIPPTGDEELILEGWRFLCKKYSPIFLEKSPHHLCQWSAIELIVDCMRELVEVDFLLIGLVRNPLDTIYSQYNRWRSLPEKVQEQWLTAYQNLLKLKDIIGNQLVIVRYEDMISSFQCLEPVFKFCGVTAEDADTAYLHSNSIRKWKKDLLFGFSLSSEAVELAEKYGYKRSELINETSSFSPMVRRLVRTSYLTVRSIKDLAWNELRKIKTLLQITKRGE